MNPSPGVGGCAGEDSNLRVGCRIYSPERSPLRHRRLGWSSGSDPDPPGSQPGMLTIDTTITVDREGLEPSHRCLQGSRSAAELLIVTRVQQESNLHAPGS